MTSAGRKSLGSYVITTAGTYKPSDGEELTGLEGMVSCAIQLDFAYGSAGGSGVTYIQTSLDGANEGGIPSGSWIDIASFTFDTQSKSRTFNFSAMTPVEAFEAGDGALTGDTQVDGILGDRLRLKTVTTGTYATSTTLAGRAVVR